MLCLYVYRDTGKSRREFPPILKLLARILKVFSILLSLKAIISFMLQFKIIIISKTTSMWRETKCRACERYHGAIFIKSPFQAVIYLLSFHQKEEYSFSGWYVCMYVYMPIIRAFKWISVHIRNYFHSWGVTVRVLKLVKKTFASTLHVYVYP